MVRTLFYAFVLGVVPATMSAATDLQSGTSTDVSATSTTIAENPLKSSDKILTAAPEIQEQLQSNSVIKRIQALTSLLEFPSSSPKLPAKLRYDLSPSDVEYVLNKCLEVVSSTLSERDAEALFASAPVWGELVKRFQLHDITKRVAQLLGSKNMFLQFFALHIIGPVDARQYEADIAKILSNGHKELRRPAREILLQWRSKELTPFLIQELKEENDFQRFKAIEALTKVGDRAAIPALLSCGSDPSENNRSAALTAVRALVPEDERTKLLVPLAREIARNSKNPEIVDNALAVLINCSDAEAVPAVIERLTAKDEATRYRIDFALERMSLAVLGEAASAALVSKQKYGEGVTNQHVRAGLVGVLKRIGTPEVIPALRVAAAESDRFIQSAAITALGELAAKEAVEDLRLQLKGQSATDAAIALSRLRDRRALNDLKAYLQRAGAVNSNFIYHLNEAYFPEFDRKLKTTKLSKTIDALPDQLLAMLTEGYGVSFKVHVDHEEWTTVAKKTGNVAVYLNEDVDNSIGRALYYINEKVPRKYCRVLRGNEVHVIRIDDAPDFIAGMFEADFQ